MSSKREQLRLQDIIDYTDRALSYCAGRSLEELSKDHRTVAAVERCLQCITEAAIKIGDARMAEIAPELVMADVRGMGNRLRHAYDEIDVRMTFDVVTRDLPPLRMRCVAALESF